MAKSKSYCFIINCASDSGRTGSFFQEQESYIKTLFPDSSFFYIGPDDRIRGTIRELNQSFDVFVACGGDGTIKEVANGVIGSGATLGVLPLGGGNDFAKSISLSTDFRENLVILKRGDIQLTDVIKAGDDYFLNTCGIGFDGLTNYYAAKINQKTGKLRYMLSGIAALLSAKKFDIELREGELLHNQRTWMVVAANGAVEGGKYVVSPNSVNNDGLLEVNVVRNINRLSLIYQFIRLSAGLGFSSWLMEEFQVKSCSLKLVPAQLSHADGEIISPKNHFSFQVKKGALKVIKGS